MRTQSHKIFGSEQTQPKLIEVKSAPPVNSKAEKILSVVQKENKNVDLRNKDSLVGTKMRTRSHSNIDFEPVQPKISVTVKKTPIKNILSKKGADNQRVNVPSIDINMRTRSQSKTNIQLTQQNSNVGQNSQLKVPIPKAEKTAPKPQQVKFKVYHRYYVIY